MIFAYSFSCCLFLAYCLAISRNLFTFAGDKIKNSTNTIFMSYKKIFLWVFALDVIIGLVTLFALGLDNSVAIAVLFLAFWGACATGILALPFLVFKKVRRIGFTLLANVIMFPILMIGCSYIYYAVYNYRLFGGDEHYKFEYKNETYRLTLRDYKNTESLSECSKEVDSTLANYKCQNEFDVMKIDNAGECGFVGGKYKKISDDEILLILDTAFVRRTREQLEINPDYYYHGLWSGKDTAILRNNLVIDLFPETVEIK